MPRGWRSKADDADGIGDDAMPGSPKEGARQTSGASGSQEQMTSHAMDAKADVCKMCRGHLRCPEAARRVQAGAWDSGEHNTGRPMCPGPPAEGDPRARVREVSRIRAKCRPAVLNADAQV